MVHLTPTETLVYRAIMDKDCYTPRQVNKEVGFPSRCTAGKHIKQILIKYGYKNIVELVIKEKMKC